jgi:dTDP-glucose pyrophosphorylase
MSDVSKVLLSPYDTVHQALVVLQQSSMRLVIVGDVQGKLLGVVSDGDIRRAILNSIPLDSPLSKIMNLNPIKVTKGASKETILKLFREKRITRIPVVDSEDRVVEILSVETVFNIENHHNPVVLMAGGLGSRLSPLTDECPKPLLKIGGKPILETILTNCIEQGFSNFYFSVNYLADQIKDYFQDGAKWGVKIQYLEEKKRLGTAGSLKLFNNDENLPLIVMNGDLLTKVDFCSLLDYHNHTNALGTMCVKQYDFQIPYGVVKENQGKIVSLEEKPVQSLLVNAGIYALSPEILKYVPDDEYFDMTQLFSSLIQKEQKTVVFPIHEYWLDIGKMQDFEQAELEFKDRF